MRVALALAAALTLAGPDVAASAKSVKIEWSGKPRTWRFGDLTVSLAAARGKAGKAPRITVASPRQGKTSLIGQGAGDQAASATVYVMRLDPKADGPAVIFTSFSWGAHCCTEIDVLDPIGGRWTVVKTGLWDGDGLTAAPSDVDGDGVADIVLRDNRFLYAFDAYAFSWAPPQVLNVVGGQLSDVSAAPRYRRLFADDMVQARTECLKHSNGACAGFVADAARLGQIDAAWPAMLKAYERKIDPMFQPTVCAAARCPPGRKVTPKAYPTALAWFLANAGYITAAKAEALIKAR